MRAPALPCRAWRPGTTWHAPAWRCRGPARASRAAGGSGRWATSRSCGSGRSARRTSPSWASAAPTGPVVAVYVPDEGAKAALIAEEPELYFTTSHFDGYAAVLCRLDRLQQDDLTELAAEAWACRASRRLLAAAPAAAGRLTRLRRAPAPSPAPAARPTAAGPPRSCDWWATISSSASANFRKPSTYSASCAGVPTAVCVSIPSTWWPAPWASSWSACSSVSDWPRPNRPMARLRLTACERLAGGVLGVGGDDVHAGDDVRRGRAAPRA